MAPSAVDTVATNDAEREYKKDKVQGVYKEAFAQSSATTKYETEINGDPENGVAPAKYPNYLPCTKPLKIR